MSENSKNIKVVVRFRPWFKSGIYKSNFSIEGSTILDTTRNASYGFDCVYTGEVSNETIYNESSKPIVESCLEGFNGTIFAYGQTASGKTHTMQGKGSQFDDGLIPYAVQHIFSTVARTIEKRFEISMTYLEVYNEKLIDLIAEADILERTNMQKPSELPLYNLGRSVTQLKITEDKKGLISVHGARTVNVTCVEDVFEILRKCQRVRHIGGTFLNERSSRSHTILTLRIESSNLTDWGHTNENDLQLLPNESSRILSSSISYRVGTLHLVDLAGSESISRSQTEGSKKLEGSRINQSLLALTKVISQIVRNQQRLIDPNAKVLYVNYRDSNLTRLLSDSLGGNSETLIICCASPENVDYRETVSTLEFAARAKCIRNKVKVNVFTSSENQIIEDNQRLRAELLQYRLRGLRRSYEERQSADSDRDDMDSQEKRHTSLVRSNSERSPYITVNPPNEAVVKRRRKNVAEMSSDRSQTFHPTFPTVLDQSYNTKPLRSSASFCSMRSVLRVAIPGQTNEVASEVESLNPLVRQQKVQYNISPSDFPVLEPIPRQGRYGPSLLQGEEVSRSPKSLASGLSQSELIIQNHTFFDCPGLPETDLTEASLPPRETVNSAADGYPMLSQSALLSLSIQSSVSRNGADSLSQSIANLESAKHLAVRNTKYYRSHNEDLVRIVQDLARFNQSVTVCKKALVCKLLSHKQYEKKIEELEAKSKFDCLMLADNAAKLEADLTAKLESLHASHEAQVSSLHSHYEKLLAEVNDAQLDKIQAAKKEVRTQLEAEIKAAKEKCYNLDLDYQDIVKSLESSLKEATTDVETLRTELRNLRRQSHKNETANDQLAAAQKIIDAQAADLLKEKQAREKLSEDLAEARFLHTEKINELLGEKCALERSIETLQKANRDAQVDLNMIRASAKEKADLHDAELQKLMLQLKSQEQQNAEHLSNILLLKGELNEAQKMVTTLEDDLSEAQDLYSKAWPQSYQKETLAYIVHLQDKISYLERTLTVASPAEKTASEALSSEFDSIEAEYLDGLESLFHFVLAAWLQPTTSDFECLQDNRINLFWMECSKSALDCAGIFSELIYAGQNEFADQNLVLARTMDLAVITMSRNASLTEAALDAVESLVSTSTQEISAAQNQLRQTQQTLEKSQADLSSLNAKQSKQLSVLEKQVYDLESELLQAKAQLAHGLLSKSAVNVGTSTEDRSNDILGSSRMMSTLPSVLTEMASRVSQLQTDTSNLKTTITRQQTAILDQKKKVMHLLQQFEQEMSLLRQQNTAFTSTITRLESSEQSKQKQIEELQVQLIQKANSLESQMFSKTLQPAPSPHSADQAVKETTTTPRFIVRSVLKKKT